MGMRKGAKDVYDLIDRFEQICKSFQDPEPEVYPKAARVIMARAGDDAPEILAACGLTPEGELTW